MGGGKLTRAVAALVILALASCSIEKKANQVMRDRVQFERVGREWVKVTPLKPKVDTIVLPGAVREVLKVVKDTVVQKVPCRDFSDTTINGVRISVKDGRLYVVWQKTKEAPDTVVIRYENTDRIDELTKDNERTKAENDVLRGVLEDVHGQYRKELSEVRAELRSEKIQKWAIVGVVIAMISAALYVRIRWQKLGFLKK